MRELVTRVLAVARSRVARWTFGIVAVALAVFAIARQRDDVVAALARLGPGHLALAALFTAANVLATGMSWRALLIDLGSRLPLAPAARVFFVGQIGKYLPGSLWPVIVQAELARDYGVPRRRAATATLELVLLGLASGMLVALACLPFVPQVAGGGAGWVLLLVVPLLVVLHPRVLGPVLDRGLRLAGGEPLEQRPSLRGTVIATGWAVVCWLAAGGQVWALAVGLGAPAGARTFALAAGGYAIAWVVGLVVVIAPAGAGAREVALAAALAGVLDGGAVLVAVLVSRVLFTAVDLAAAGVGVGLGRRRAAVARSS